VSNKAVGFHIYQLQRFVGWHFEASFHPWNNGVAHWQREKLIWEQEQEKEWTRVLTKSQKRQASLLLQKKKFVLIIANIILIVVNNMLTRFKGLFGSNQLVVISCYKLVMGDPNGPSY
jgi:lipopolysaccharide biosynthesis glycosyltransferase